MLLLPPPDFLVFEPPPLTLKPRSPRFQFLCLPPCPRLFLCQLSPQPLLLTRSSKSHLFYTNPFFLRCCLPPCQKQRGLLLLEPRLTLSQLRILQSS